MTGNTGDMNNKDMRNNENDAMRGSWFFPLKAEFDRVNRTLEGANERLVLEPLCPIRSQHLLHVCVSPSDSRL